MSEAKYGIHKIISRKTNLPSQPKESKNQTVVIKTKAVNISDNKTKESKLRNIKNNNSWRRNKNGRNTQKLLEVQAQETKSKIDQQKQQVQEAKDKEAVCFRICACDVVWCGVMIVSDCNSSGPESDRELCMTGKSSPRTSR